MLAWLGDRVEKGRVPIIGRRKRSGGDSRAWGCVIDRVMRRPLVSAVAAPAVCCVVLAAARARDEDGAAGPRHLPARHRGDADLRPHPGGVPGRDPIPATVVVEADDVTSRRGAAAIAGHAPTSAVASGGFAEPATDRELRRTGPSRAWSCRSPATARTTGRSTALDELRDDDHPGDRRVASTASEADVTGITAGTEDFNDVMKSRICRGCSRSCSGLAFLLLLVTFRSIVIPLKAIVLNLLSVGAAYGVAGARVPGRPRRVAAGLRVDRRDHVMAAAVPVRGAVRALDGLPRVHPQPDPGAGGPRRSRPTTPWRTGSSRPPAS